MGGTVEEALGPIDFLLLELDPDHMDGTIAAALLDLVDRGVVTLSLIHI